MTGFILPFLVSCATGVLSGWGVGGGTLLIIFMTAVRGVPQRAAQGINLLYFIPCSGAALFSHIKNGLIEKTAVYAAVCGALTAAGAAFAAAHIDAGLMKKLFSVFLLYTGVSELLRK